MTAMRVPRGAAVGLIALSVLVVACSGGSGSTPAARRSAEPSPARTRGVAWPGFPTTGRVVVMVQGGQLAGTYTWPVAGLEFPVMNGVQTLEWMPGSHASLGAQIADHVMLMAPPFVGTMDTGLHPKVLLTIAIGPEYESWRGECAVTVTGSSAVHVEGSFVCKEVPSSPTFGPSPPLNARGTFSADGSGASATP